VPAVRLSPAIAYLLIIGGLIFNFLGLAWLGIIVFGVSVVFMLITVPVELDASRRAIKLLDQAGLLVTEEDRTGAKTVLRAAALTYVAAAVTSILTLLYYISLVQRSRR
jgi:Zn-dependent membrane protease YugP